MVMSIKKRKDFTARDTINFKFNLENKTSHRNLPNVGINLASLLPFSFLRNFIFETFVSNIKCPESISPIDKFFVFIQPQKRPSCVP